MTIFIGITGPLGSGKGEVVKILEKLASKRGIKVETFSLSDEIRKEIEREGKHMDRESLKLTANRFRSSFGNGIWAHLVAAEIKDQVQRSKENDVLYIIDAIRNPGEVKELRSSFGGRFKLMGVTAPPDVINENIKRRKRVDESKAILSDKQKLYDLLQAEMGVLEPGYGHNVTACIKMVDIPVIINDGSKFALEEASKERAEKHIFPFI